ncbi:hypothetical protein CR513_01146, partial [Mucuna pruriens]
MVMDRNTIDATSGGALMDKTLEAARHLISNMVSNTQQFGTRGALAIGKHQPGAPVRVCGICTSVEHPTNMCPTLQETKLDNAEIVG